MTVSVVNQSNQVKIVTLRHQEVCVRFGKCLCSGGTPLTIHIPVGRATKGVTDAIRLAPDASGLIFYNEAEPNAVAAKAKNATVVKNVPKNKKGKSGKVKGQKSE